jgi:hypothetical protein
MRADGTGVTWVRRGELPQVSGDGTRIAFIADDTETSRPAVYTAARDGSGAKVLHADDNLTSVDDWAPNHDLVLFTERDGDSLFLAGSAAGVQAGFGFLHDDRHFHNDGPSWSPDGAHIAFATRASGISGCDDTGDPTCGGDPDVGIRTMDLGGGGLRVVHPGYATQPVWSPDGAKLALNIDGKIYVIDSQGGGKRVLTTGSGADWQPVKRVEIPWDPPVPPSPPEPETRTVTVTVQAPPPPPAVVEKVVTRVVTTAGKVCPIPKGKRRLTLTIRAKRAIKKGASVKVWLDVSSGRVNVPKGRPVRVTAW